MWVLVRINYALTHAQSHSLWTGELNSSIQCVDAISFSCNYKCGDVTSNCRHQIPPARVPYSASRVPYGFHSTPTPASTIKTNTSKKTYIAVETISDGGSGDGSGDGSEGVSEGFSVDVSDFGIIEEEM